MPQSQAAALPRPQEEEETDKSNKEAWQVLDLNLLRTPLEFIIDQK